ncbi:1-(5-phosphoribosyl)-5-[(5-phosphoribosylamino)methylideneamino]imidazole-4-carboxamide isomerase [Pyrinomonas methylaliphatogenes]|uniref:1-(5-phosphoribosyl)-5-[(5-phosphoribosylamino)methylideneamino] imidazole-4-carboxamide isomerase n=1 Tax=Pyrinomonas methylaliphatogenes TaxID=454194 RepID=A0A0B6WYA5_9BACT|nr:1-(5-phosphoribosyl)-5-[(5-phosphoribosylamino)methylideneamino]imidazole-4-carboxamide isomerase [Pyrinomonas methylaliphatogenes]MBX5478346.1 1-(5-phosphoribosyl)-5-[(5-phosphoribosylamino)methylideneamino]imidazole-4-carboxamide isomerase [Pyrinomonas methylaliphatogenes]CDM65722.1 1-(5-phosphoribosyl)-5-((5-phosphoribosylamino)methylideneamino) imidazole-4-carboxamide isomerase [Pyrinomonas methylaliphatogenes]
MLVIPAIDLKEGRCVRLTQGRRSDVKVYDADPVDVAKSFEDAGARMIHVVDLDGAFEGPNSINRKVVRRIIRAVEIPVQFGGGLRSVHDVQQMIEYGAAQVVIGTLAAESPETLELFVQLFGFRIAVGIDARNGQVVTHGWEKEEKISAIELAQRVADAGVDRIVYTDVTRDGTLTGVNVEQTCAIARESGLKVTASGGVSSLDDIRRLKAARSCGIDSVIVGKALYEGRFTLQEALRIA